MDHGDDQLAQYALPLFFLIVVLILLKKKSCRGLEKKGNKVAVTLNDIAILRHSPKLVLHFLVKGTGEFSTLNRSDDIPRKN